MPARAIGSGTLSFGLVSIPVKLYSTSQHSKSVRFNMLDPSDGSRVKQTQAELEEKQRDLQTLYEHWEEASGLN